MAEKEITVSLNPQMVISSITNEQYYVFPDTEITVCCLTLKMPGGTCHFTGQSGCINPEDFDLEKGRSAARQKALNAAFDGVATHLKMGGSQ